MKTKTENNNDNNLSLDLNEAIVLRRVLREQITRLERRRVWFRRLGQLQDLQDEIKPYKELESKVSAFYCRGIGFMGFTIVPR